MEQRLSGITLGVADVARSTAFYTQLGWTPWPQSKPEITFFQLGGIMMMLWGRGELADDAGLPGPSHSPEGIALAYNTRSREEVDGTLQQAVAAGGKLLRPAHDTFWGGYSGYFADPDGHLWEVAWNPFIQLDAAGAVQLPD